MVDEKLFDYRQYIEERLREIDDLEERRYAKEILSEGLARIFDLSEQRYQQLEQRISQEMESPQNGYEIVTAVTELSQYDPIHGTLFPVILTDVNTAKDENKGTVTIYLAADDTACKEFIEEKIIIGTTEEREVAYKISHSKRYGEALEKLYRVFQANQVPWRTVHTGYLERFFDLEPLEETDGNVTFQWGRWEPYIRSGLIPLWNIRESALENHKFALPCPDGICYEHTFTMKDREEGTYLVESNEDTREIRHEQGRIIIKSQSKKLKWINISQICSVDGMRPYRQLCFPVLSNRRADSFAARYLYKTGNFIQTEAELFRKVGELAQNSNISLAKYEIKKKAAAVPLLHPDMNYFIREEVFSGEQRSLLILYFAAEERDYLSQAHIRYLLSQIQLEYMEYKCAGAILDT